MRFALEQFDSVFKVRNATGEPYILIGGQAVNYWAETYLAIESELAASQPFTSEDIDFHGGRDDVIRIAGALGLNAQFPPKVAMTAVAGMILFKIGNALVNIEVVRRIPGLPENKINSWSVIAQYGDKKIRVLDPISLLVYKANLASSVDQKQRRDVEHLHIMVICVRAFLRETLRGVEAGELPARGWLGAVERVLKLADSAVGKKVVRKFGVDWKKSLPEKEIAASHHRLVIGLGNKRLPQWREKQS